jgi:cell division protein FtsZ
VLDEADLDLNDSEETAGLMDPAAVDAVGLWGTELVDRAPETSTKVVGCGGAGSRLIGWLETILPGNVETIAIDTDKDGLERINADTKILLQHPDGSSEEPIETVEDAHSAMDTAREQVEELLEPSDVVFLLTGLGGMTGTGIVPSISDAARSTEATVVCIATLPHELETGRRRRAWSHVGEVSESVDTFALLDPAKFADYSDQTGVGRVFEQINRYIVEAVRQLITRIDDFNMIQWDSGFLSLLDDGGFATLISNSIEPDEDVKDVVERLLDRSLIDVESGSADRAILLMRGAPGIDDEDVHDIVGSVATHAEHVAWVYNVDENLSEEIRVTGIVTGLTVERDETEAARTEHGEETEEGSLVFMSSGSPSAPA